MTRKQTTVKTEPAVFKKLKKKCEIRKKYLKKNTYIKIIKKSFSLKTENKFSEFQLQKLKLQVLS